MKISNDNHASEDDALLCRAKEMLANCDSLHTESCGLTNGGFCPLLKSIMASLPALKIQITA